MTTTVIGFAEPPIRLDPAERWDFLLTIPHPTDRECLQAFATPDGVTALAGFPNVVKRAAKVAPDLPLWIEKMPPGLVVDGVVSVLQGARKAVISSATDGVDFST